MVGFLSAQSIEGVVISMSNNAALDDCLVQLVQGEEVKSFTRTNFDGYFKIDFKKNKSYVLEVIKSGYKIKQQEITLDDAFLSENAMLRINMEPLNLKPKFDEVKDGTVKPVPNPDIMEDIGNLSNLPEGYKIIDAQPIQKGTVQQSKFNVNLNDPVEKTNVNVEVLKEKFNKDNINEVMLNKTDKFPSSYYAESSVYYGPGKALLTESVEETLNGIAQRLNEDKKAKLQLTAYADGFQEASIGEFISKKRVEEITNYLLEQGVKFSQLNISVSGNTSLANGCYEGKECSEFEHQQNRRVEIAFIE